MTGQNGWILWAVLAGAGVVGYLVVAKIVDFFTKSRVWEPPTGSPPDAPSERIGGHDPTKPIR